jgi:hypothetical protein
VAPAGASASTLTAGPLVTVPDQPLAATGPCDDQINFSEGKGSKNYPDTVAEPMVAVDPTNPMHLVAAFQQDRWDDGGDLGNLGVVSTDGGKSWSLAGTQPAFTICTGGTLDRASDPTVAFSSDGSTVYQAGLAFNANGPAFGGTSSVQVSRSTDGGKTWQQPVIVKEDTSTTVLNDKDWITADPTNSRNAYVVWDRLVSPSVNANPGAFETAAALRGPSWFSETTDRGTTWTTPKIMYDPGQKNQTIGNEIVAPAAGPAAGDLLDGFTLILNKGVGGKNFRQATYVAVIRSTNGGATWSAPTIVNPLVVADASSLDGQQYRTADDLPQFTTNPINGNLYVVWQDGRFSTTGQPKVAFSESTDGGTTWSTPTEIDQAPAGAATFTPQIAVNSAGTIGVTYYDNERATFSNPGFTDEYIVHCHAATADCSKPANWAAGGETLLSTSGSFDMLTAPLTPTGFFVGDYEGLTASGTTFDPFFVMSQPISTNPFSTTAG